MTTHSLYKTFSDLVITPEDYQTAEVFAIQFLQAQYPTLDLRDGSAIKDLLIRPTASLIALTVKGVDKHFTDNSIDGVTDDTNEDVVNSIMSNWFVTRNEGSNSVLTLRLKFSSVMPGDGTSVPTSAFFSPDNISRFFPTTAVTLSKQDGSLKLYTDLTSQYYYGDISVTSESVGDAYNLEVGTEMLYFTIFDPYFIGAEVVTVNEVSVDKETNTEFIDRSEQAVSTRNLINDISISQQMGDRFNYVTSVYASGLGDYEQMRDYREIVSPTTGFSVPFHNGGYVDIYCKTPLAQKVVRVQADSSGVVRFPIGIDPIYRIALPGVGEIPTTMIDGSPLYTGPDLLQVTDINDIIIQDQNYLSGPLWYEKEAGFSPRQEITIEGTPASLNGNQAFDIKIYYYQYMSSVQAFLDDSTSRVVTANYISRGYNVVDIQPVVNLISTVPTNPDDYNELLDRVYTAANTYVSNLVPGESFISAEMLANIVDEIPEYQFSTNIPITYTLYPSEVGVALTGSATSAGVIDGPTVVATPGHDENSSVKIAKTFMIYLNKENITLSN